MPDIWTNGKDEECGKDATDADCIYINGLHDESKDANEKTIRERMRKRKAGGRLRKKRTMWKEREEYESKGGSVCLL